MNYHNITYPDQNNGDGLRIVLWVAGCEHHCTNCQNQQTWSPQSGIPFDKNAMNEILNELKKDYISGITFSGGDPLHPKNVQNVLKIVDEIRVSYPTKNIWLYTGYTWEQIMHPVITDINSEQLKMLQMRKELVSKCNVLIDGRYVDELRDISLHWRGSSNQRVINVQETLKQKQIVLWES
ncbi:anaerobic ribonucleoside-triphosphate reductase activating protein [Blautia wexlerae]|jgi:anaerobic ribonucleoside-triphosphate reductase activating protein|uniref:anaerobic ribonucleoside-triphosphate reductase activating protein n=1 Tax=Blautia wexlerae TaxID=418240 RepID=UPI0015707A9F|nr:anaerobic ribonucleoside-triphosphate reductase activating protein [Blautia wexlerae]DAZ78512.1 MAG TPA: 4Fe-4S single cluster domain protein [Caudoviricetes sp.]NSD46603.1 anaerobic ribonucleoside-triphosphate reductase activating protein [Blautia wexlerae]NSD50495.1 anaerobic ribonucleoside-triphosphate reductase activating protein [Blautia wexlerae]NSK03230.1 anaerobic ribonucleoside-triphosphate reductase activating protein [Blautia wexlerae]NSK40235.1 anaerobic ribonucleoside-triphosph